MNFNIFRKFSTNVKNHKSEKLCRVLDGTISVIALTGFGFILFNK